MRVCVTGGCGYIGSALVPALLERKHDVTVLDAMLFGNHLQPHANLTVVEGDIRELPAEIQQGRFDAVIHLACIANDPSWALDPAWGKAVNYDALGPLVQWAKDAGVQRFIYASSSSVYGTQPEGMQVTEDVPCERTNEHGQMVPVALTPYSEYKYRGEQIVLESGMKATVLRPATVCGYASRLRLDVVVNQMTIDALTKGVITVHAGDLYRAHLHVADMARAYVSVLEAESRLVEGQTFNVGGENLKIRELANKVQAQTGVLIADHAATNDPRSYTLNSDRIWRVLGFRATKTVNDAIASVIAAYRSDHIPEPDATHYHNIRRMEELVQGRCLTS